MLNKSVRYLFFSLFLTVFSVDAILPEKEQEHLTAIAADTPQKAIEYIDEKLNSIDKNSLTYLDYLEVKGGIYSQLMDANKMLEVATEGYQRAKAINSQAYQSNFLTIQANAKSLLSEFEASYELFDKALAIAKSLDDPKLIGLAYAIQGKTLLRAERFEEAMKTLKLAYSAFDRANEEENKYVALNELSRIAYAMGDYDQTAEYLQEVIEYYKKSNNVIAASVLKYNLGTLYLAQKKLDKAQDVLTDARAFSIKHGNDVMASYSEFGLGDIAVQKENPELAVKFYQSAHTGLIKNGVFDMAYTTILRLAETHISLKDFNKVNHYLKLAEERKDKMQAQVRKNEILRITSLSLEAQENYKQALEKQKEYIETYKDNVKKDNQEAIHKLKTQFDSERKATQNELLKKENSLQKAMLTQQDYVRNFLIALLGIAALTFVVFLYFYKKQQLLKNKLAQQALTDELTGASNRRHILHLANDRFSVAQRYNTSLCIGIIDLDHFKLINDTYGHDIGDIVLKEFSQICNKSIRQQDSFGRYGGEEWLIIFPHTEIEKINIVITRIREALQKTKFPMDKQPTFSIGLTQVTQKDKSLQDILKRADEALYQAKDEGRNRTVIL